MCGGTFANRLMTRIHQVGTPLCLGLDPVLGAIETQMGPGGMLDLQRAGIPTDDPPKDGRDQAVRLIESFCFQVLQEVSDHVAAVKIQVAFFEAYGAPGWAALERTVSRARDLGLVVLADAKRGDIDSTACAYKWAFFGGAPYLDGTRSKGLGVDALTVHPYLGLEALDPLFRACEEEGAGLYCLARTSNPGGDWIQDRCQQDVPAYLELSRRLLQLQENRPGLAGGLCLVVGATMPAALSRLVSEWSLLPLLLPGVGAQGASANEIARALQSHPGPHLVPISRAILYPEAGSGLEGIKAAVHRFRKELQPMTAAERPCPKAMIEGIPS